MSVPATAWAAALRGVLMALLPPEAQAPLRAVYRLGLEAMGPEEEGLAETDGRSIRIHPVRFPALPQGQALYVLAHEIFHVALDHPGRAGRLLGWAGERVREAAARARAGIPPAEVDPEAFPGWRAAWEAVLGGDWPAWEARIREVLPDLVNVAADLLVNAWVDLLADLVIGPGRTSAWIEPPPGAVRVPEREARAWLLGTSLEALFARFLRSLIAALPDPEGSGGVMFGAGSPGGEPISLVIRIPRQGPLPLPDGGAGRDLRVPGEDAPGEGERRGGGETGDGPEAGLLPNPLFREGLRKILEAAQRRGLLPGDLTERIFPRQAVRLPWRRVLRAWLRPMAPEPEADWTRRDPRVKIPGSWVPRIRELPEGTGMALLLAARDVSGSMDPETLGRIAGEIQDLAGQIPRLQALAVLDVDADLQGLVLVPLREALDLPIPVAPGLRIADRLAEALEIVRGRGGTVFHPVFRALRGEDPSPLGQALGQIARSGRAAGMIFFTDGDASFPPPTLRPPFPVLWVVPRRAPVPFGTILEAPELFRRALP